MVPTERLRVVWKRKSGFSSYYELDTKQQDQRHIGQNLSSDSCDNSENVSGSNRYQTDQVNDSVGGSFMGIGDSVSYNQANAKIDGSSNSDSNPISKDWRNACTWCRAAIQDRQTAHDDAKAQNDAPSFQELIQKTLDFSTYNRQFIKFIGEKFIVKPVKA
ncbi:unnamed protein product [Rotaria socialis]|nr:unnamed protein product [Rotaria socialis]CAF4347158.1 unnamed protein product [Rotaria socialis]